MGTSRKIDRTYLAVKRQLVAMGVERFELGVYDRERDTMRNFEVNMPDVLKRLDWLKRENSQGRDIYIRPQGSQGLIFFDDLNKQALERLSAESCTPAVVVESSPMNYQGWIRVADGEIPEKLATAICKFVAREYGGDNDSADWRHYGRLAGFTNRKPAYVNEVGRFPFVLLVGSQGRLTVDALRLVAEGKRILQLQQAARRVIVERASITDGEAACDFFKAQLSSLQMRYGLGMDTSRADWMIITKMVGIGYSRDAVKQALLTHSLAFAKRQRNHAHTYLAVTLDNAFGDDA
ncbi:MAG: RepB family DNA primase [Pseudomonadales bacterium]|nr:RepB family DNA primase [Pseudomonadales bacterium]